MRLQRGVPVAGIDPALARALAIACQGDWAYTGYVARRCKISAADAHGALLALTAEGFVEQRDVDVLSAEVAADDQIAFANQWTTTLSGGALTMASFLRPISRRKAEALLGQVIGRAQAYNADDAKPLLISEVTVFGSYLRGGSQSRLSRQMQSTRVGSSPSPQRSETERRGRWRSR